MEGRGDRQGCTWDRVGVRGQGKGIREFVGRRGGGGLGERLIDGLKGTSLQYHLSGALR